MNVSINLKWVLGILMFWCLNLSSQCPDSDIILSSDEEIIHFVRRYPDCISLTHSLTIGPSKEMATSRITDVSPLHKLKKIGGSLTVVKNPWLTDLTGLQGIEDIAGKLELELQSDKTFRSSLLKAGGLVISYPSCFSCSADYIFPQLIKLSGPLQVSVLNNKSHAFPVLWKVEGDLLLSGNADYFKENEFPKLYEVQGELELRVKGFKPAISVLPALKKLNILNCRYYEPHLASIGVLESCNEIYISSKNKFIFESLSKIRRLKKLELYAPDSIMIHAFRQLVYVEDLLLDGATYALKGELKTNFKSLKKVDHLKLAGNSFSHIYPAIDSLAALTIYTIKDSILNVSCHNGVQNLRVEYCYMKQLHIDIPTLTNLHIADDEKLETMTINQQLELTGRLQISNCRKLKTAAWIDSLKCNQCYLSVYNNPELEVCIKTWCNIIKNVAEQQCHISGNKSQCTVNDIMVLCK